MKDKILKKIRMLCDDLKAMASSGFAKPQKEIAREQTKATCNKPHMVAYQIVGQQMEYVLPLFKGLDSDLHRSGIKVNFKAYVSLTVLVTIIAMLAVLTAVPCLLFFVLGMPFLPAVLFGVGGSLFTFAFSIIAFYFYPIYRADKLRRELEDELPFTTGYMAILTGAGVSPERVFYSLSNLSVPLAISTEARDVIRNVSLFGQDIISALEEASKQTPSERLRELLEGFISTIHSGSSSTAYLREKSKQYMKLKRISLKKFSDTLSILSEFYVTILLTGPLVLIIMLATMAMLGGGSLGILSPDLLLNLLTYVGIPLGAIMFLIILDAVTPKW
ncbi:type II secretion system F family protein [Candidatus Bathyarchaeota archaeon]|nr:type II secretion system F family protein [Candidatus Bathyarchaeota archaeon]